jgi:hypothetical protein
MSGYATTTTDDRVVGPITARTILLGFAAGVVSVLVFHQGTVWLLHMAGQVPNAPYGLRPIPPFGVPQIVNSCFWGGLWGIVIAVLLRRLRVPDLLFGFVFGAVALGLTNWVVLPAIKGGAFFAGGDPRRLAITVAIVGTFGWGVALILRGLRNQAWAADPMDAPRPPA